jgi:hypothetical protein
MSNETPVYVTWDKIYPQGHSGQQSVDEMEVFSGQSSEYSGSPQSVTTNLANAPNAYHAVLSPLVDLPELYRQLPRIYDQLRNNPDLSRCLQGAVGHLSQNIWPGDEAFRGFVRERNGRYHCVLYDCERYNTGWDREDRARDHFITSHIGRVYKCPHWCAYLHSTYSIVLTLVPRSPQTCKRPHDMNVHIASHGAVSGFTCPVW